MDVVVVDIVSGNNSLKVFGSETFTDQGHTIQEGLTYLSFMLKTRFKQLRNLPESPTFDVDPAGFKPPTTPCAS